MFMGIVVLFICSACCVKNSPVVLSELRMRFVWAHACISCMYHCMFAFAMFLSMCLDVIEL